MRACDPSCGEPVIPTWVGQKEWRFSLPPRKFAMTWAESQYGI